MEASGPARISVGRTHACARMSDDSLRCWGGNIGDVVEVATCWGDVRPCPWTPADCRHETRHRGSGGSPLHWQYCPKPTALPGVTSAIALSMGWDRSCALTSDGAVWCWGGGDPPARVAL